uniref:Uncharacterized protein n=1 Tax=Poecilia mexicana TaxID=48701 RepID=A0A3B3XJX2_9TELE
MSPGGRGGGRVTLKVGGRAGRCAAVTSCQLEDVRRRSRTGWCRTRWCRTGWCRTRWCRTRWCRTRCCGTRWCRTRWCRTRWCRTGWCRTRWCRTRWCRTGWCRTRWCRTRWCLYPPGSSQISSCSFWSVSLTCCRNQTTKSWMSFSMLAEPLPVCLGPTVCVCDVCVCDVCVCVCALQVVAPILFLRSQIRTSTSNRNKLQQFGCLVSGFWLQPEPCKNPVVF